MVHNCNGVLTGLWMGKGKGLEGIHRTGIHFLLRVHQYLVNKMLIMGDSLHN